jgi:hypothetical protein
MVVEGAVSETKTPGKLRLRANAKTKFIIDTASRDSAKQTSPASVAYQRHWNMARNKKSAQADAAANGSAPSTPPPPTSNGASTAKKPAKEPSTSALIICRNK